MKSTGMVRAVDKMGRVVIPKEIRRQLKVENDVDSFEIYMDGDKVVLKKYQPTCIFCDSLADSVEFGRSVFAITDFCLCFHQNDIGITEQDNIISLLIRNYPIFIF